MNAELWSEAELLVADAVGDVIEHWGFRKALGRVWTVLYLSGETLPAADLSERLQMSAGSVSSTLTELQRWAVVRRVWRPGERREFFEAETDFWKMISKVVAERERFVARSVRERLVRATEILSRGRDAGSRARLERVQRLLAFTDVAERVIDTFVASRRADFGSFGDLLALPRSLAAKVRRA
jgi:DNA-binding transcriptional regulator GbsR (MarR family)